LKRDALAKIEEHAFRPEKNPFVALERWKNFPDKITDRGIGGGK